MMNRLRVVPSRTQTSLTVMLPVTVAAGPGESVGVGVGVGGNATELLPEQHVPAAGPELCAVLR
jgi:hypothetical protein